MMEVVDRHLAMTAGGDAHDLVLDALELFDVARGSVRVPVRAGKGEKRVYE